MEITIDIYTGTFRKVGTATFTKPDEVSSYMEEVRKLDKHATYLLLEVKQK